MENMMTTRKERQAQAKKELDAAIAADKAKLEADKIQMLDNVDKMLSNMEKADDLEEKAKALSEASDTFRTRSSSIKRANPVVGFFKGLWNVITWPFRMLASIVAWPFKKAYEAYKGNDVDNAASAADENIDASPASRSSSPSFSPSRGGQTQAESLSRLQGKTAVLADRTRGVADDSVGFAASAKALREQAEQDQGGALSFFGFGKKAKGSEVPATHESKKTR